MKTLTSTSTLLALLSCACGSTTAANPEPATARAPEAQARAAAPAPALPSRADCAAALDVHFALDSSALDELSRDRLSQVGQCLRDDGRRQVTVVGMADPRGTEEYNLALGERRAHAVASYLAALDTQPPAVRSVGEEQATGRDEQGYALDRRAEVR